ncbi:alpha/beta hydrolase [Sphingomonas sp. J344]|uniref:alpha/beta fold hydrolase n=1 Tax=Sphingomonas sp. J344 TaxID=2898434 RepID=UPI00215127EC|nr:alpha/beta hydrolase [Sphingomonas sp. J344]MCR5872419.1 alpha/beta hydrolase [Sphingomonas sp. J344]
MTETFESFDGQTLAWREMGQGRPVVLIHGYFSDAQTNWIKYGTAAKLVDAGFRVIMPDLRAHGDSARPHDPAAYPPDALAQDAEALIAHLRLTDYDLGGYSLGARTTMRVLARGIAPTPRRVILSGLGDEGVTDTGRRAGILPPRADRLRQLRARRQGIHVAGIPQDHRRRPGGTARYPRYVRRYAARSGGHARRAGAGGRGGGG